MKKADLELYTDYLPSTFGQTTATGHSAMVDSDLSHDRITRFYLSANTARKIYGYKLNPRFVASNNLTVF